MATTYNAKGKVFLTKSQFDARKAAGTLQTGIEYMIADSDDTPYVTESETPTVKKIAIFLTDTSDKSVIIDIKNPISSLTNVSLPVSYYLYNTTDGTCISGWGTILCSADSIVLNDNTGNAIISEGIAFTIGTDGTITLTFTPSTFCATYNKAYINIYEA